MMLGRELRRPMAWVIALTVGSLVTAVAPGLGSPGYVPVGAVPDGWKPASEPETFEADNLYEHINGAAPGYLRYSFKQLTVEPLQLADDPKTEILVEVYEFGKHLDAFGIYSNERAPNLSFVKLGAEGYFVGPTCRFYKGLYYVKLNATRDNEIVQGALEALSGELARSLAGETKAPALLGVIPPQAVIEASQRYEGSDLLAHDFLGAGFTADYDLGGEKSSKLFFTVMESRADARKAYYKLLSFLRKRGEVGERVSPSRGRGRVTKHPYYGPSLICRAGPVVCGVLRVPSEEAGQELVDELLERLDRAGAL